VAARSDGGRAKVDGLRKRMAAAHSEGGRVEATMCSRASDEAAMCSGAGIKDDRQRWHRDGF
jgi:hypothetical protein